MAVDWSQPKKADTNGIQMSYYDAGAGTPVVLLHGFPELAFSWRHQVEPLVAAGFRVVIPSQRGYPGTDSPSDVDSFNVRNLVADLTGLLDALELSDAVVVGHDWGGLPTWYSPIFEPDRILGVASLCTPFMPRGDVDFVQQFQAMRGQDNYVVQFQEPGRAESLLGGDIRHTFHSILRGKGVTLEQFRRMPDDVTCLPMGVFVAEPQLLGDLLVDDAELDAYVTAYRESGFTGPLNWYRSLPFTWKRTEGFDMSIDKPALMISAEDDWFLPPEMTDGMEGFVPKVEKHVIPGGHWIQQENPAAVNSLLVEWLKRNFS